MADNGRSALNMYRDAHANRKPYSLVCLDGGLPEMDGQALLQEIRRFEKANAILGRDGARIMFISSDTRKEVIIAAFRNQCDGFMLMPFRKRELVYFLHEQGLVRE